ncbi:MAG TPA: hypothetical protein VEQ61_00700, partial [Thermoleophilaceae bacterium]|nr:hypothetical protein [Thermoleophilaceae bacterium]
MTQTIELDARFNGPPQSANGGYACGVVAKLLEAETAEVSLRSPPPLGKPLEVVREGKRALLRDGETLVAEGEAGELLFDVPDAATLDEASRASRAGRERWSSRHPFPTCVVCGPERGGADCFGVFPGPLESRAGLFAATWTPDDALADDEGQVSEECVWAALDCPTSEPVANFGEGPPLVLARLTARVACPVYAGEPHALLSWPLELDGRKRHAGSA